MSNLKKYIFLPIATAICFFVFSCDNSRVGENQVIIGDKVVDDTINGETNIIYKRYKIPLPVEMIANLKNSAGRYNKDALNPIERAPKYMTEVKMALNLGVYSADLAYNNIYERSQASLEYYNVARQLSDKLEIIEGFDRYAIDRLNANLDNPDSLLEIGNQTYWRTCVYLDQKKKNNILPFLVYGGWVETMHLVFHSKNEYFDETKVRDVIIRQGESINRLTDYLYKMMLETSAYYYNSDIKVLIFNLNALQKIYDKIHKQNGATVEQYKKIVEKLNSMRDEIVKN